jgi:hypothetical protein
MLATALVVIFRDPGFSLQLNNGLQTWLKHCLVFVGRE